MVVVGGGAFYLSSHTDTSMAARENATGLAEEDKQAEAPAAKDVQVLQKNEAAKEPAKVAPLSAYRRTAMRETA